MRRTLLVSFAVLLLALPRGAQAWPTWSVSGGVATASGVGDPGAWQSYGPVLTTDVTWRGAWSECFTGVSVTGLVAPDDATGSGSTDRVRPMSILAGEVGAGVGVPLFTVGLYGGWGWPGGTVGLYSRVTAPGPTEWSRRVGVEARLFASTAVAATGGALLVRVEPELRARRGERTPRAAAPAETAAPAPGPASAPEQPPSPEAPPPAAPPSGTGHHDDPYGD